MRASFISTSVFCLVFALSGCGGGGSSGGSGNAGSNPPPVPAPPPSPPPGGGADPFGLNARPSLASFTLPTQGSGAASFDLVNAFPNLRFDTALYAAGVPGENRLVVVEQNGRILAFEDSPTVTSARTLLDISGRVLSGGESGLLGLAFDPDFQQNRYVYMHYSLDAPLRSVIARMTWNESADLIQPASEKTILVIDQPFTNHNGGMLTFGPDGHLYIGMGDGGSGGDPNNLAQNTTTLLGKMLRIDVHPLNPNDPYDVPADNPFVNDSAVDSRIYAIGLRNPFRFSFDRQTGDLWLGDVGQTQREEINIIEAGNNYGWRVREGNLPFDDSQNTLPLSAFTSPVIDYGRSEGIAVIGGYVYRGSQFGALFGRYLYTDFLGGSIWALAWDGSQVVSNDVIVSTTQNFTSFGEKNNGELLLVGQGGTLFDLQPSGGGGGQIPTLLSQTGIFTDLVNLTPASGLIEYEPSQPFWSDGVDKRRWVGVPDNEQVDFTALDWSFPEGTVTVKHFEVDLNANDASSTRRLETRVFLHTSQGWQGFTYRWNQAQTDATLLASRETETLNITRANGSVVSQTYEYPSRVDCLGCHTEQAGFVLGLETRQLNTNFDYAGVIDNQLRSLNNISWFDRDIGTADQYGQFPALDDVAASTEDKARAYLDINCSQCHRPNSTAPTNLDLRAETALASMNAVDVMPQAGTLGLQDARIIAVGDKSRSVLWLRMQQLDGNRMPPLSTHVVDEAGVEIIGTWIDGL
ncbi:MAG: PQQ-dependent sugar dehydrogenase [Pseudomonadaceae bacterium]|nr:PQQ-dependent sugar dehydrogenase [Pseudomonadaceae bacterium]